MLTILKNNYFRTRPRLPLVLIMTALMLVMIVLAIYFTGKQQVRGHIVLISQETDIPARSAFLDIELKREMPPLSALVQHRYDAYVRDLGQQNYEVTTLKNDSYRAMLLNLLQHPDRAAPVLKEDRGVGVNIIGFLMMFMLMSAFMNLFTFADDKEKGQLVRIFSSPVSLTGYLAGHIVYCLSMFLPVYLVLVVMKIVGFSIGFSLWQYALLMLIISTLGIAFALLLNTFFNKQDNASMLGNSVLTLTSILAGSFYSFDKDNDIMNAMVSVLPQKQILAAASNMESHTFLAHPGPLLYVVLLILALFVISAIKLRRQYVVKS